MQQMSLLACDLRTLETNAEFTEAVLTLRDGTRLCFIHNVTKRQVMAVGPEGAELARGRAETILDSIRYFRLNAKHLEIWFQDESRWEHKFRPESSS